MRRPSHRRLSIDETFICLHSRSSWLSTSSDSWRSSSGCCCPSSTVSGQTYWRPGPRPPRPRPLPLTRMPGRSDGRPLRRRRPSSTWPDRGQARQPGPGDPRPLGAEATPSGPGRPSWRSKNIIIERRSSTSPRR